jgi:hypothetical protein
MYAEAYMSNKVTGVNVEGRLYEFLAGQAVRGSCTALASDWIKPIVLPEGVALVDGILLVVSFLNGNSVGLDEPVSIYSSDGENFFYDQSLTDPVTFPPADCYEVEFVSGQEYSYMNWPCMQYGDTILPIRNPRGHTVAADAWDGGDIIPAVFMTDLFILLLGGGGGGAAVDVVEDDNMNAVTSNAVSQALKNKLGAKMANSYYGMTVPDGSDNQWIRTTSQGIIPYQSGGRTGGHNYLGTSSWYFAYGYIQNMYVNKLNLSSTAGTENGDIWIV